MLATIAGPGVLPRHVAQPRHDAVERAERVVDLRRRGFLRQHPIEAQRRQEFLQVGDGELSSPSSRPAGQAERAAGHRRSCRPAAPARS